jgi:predicted phage baseplate assembly protein
MLPAPALDDPQFQDLVDDAKRLVQRRCPEWTDHNVSDPGVTLIETFAYMTDVLLYRLNRVPDRMYVKFLDLIGLRMFPPTAAQVPVTFWLSTPPEVPFRIPAATRVTTAGNDQVDPVVFSTGAELAIVPCQLAALVTSPTGVEAADRTMLLEMGSPVAVFSNTPVVDDAVYVGLDNAVPQCAVRLDVVARAEGVGVNPKQPPLVWEAWCDGQWVAVDVGSDGTGGFNRPGEIILHVPAGHTMSVYAGQACGWLRARVIDPEPGQPQYSASPIFEGLAACTVGGTTAAVHADIIASETLGTSEGVPGQRFALASRPVLAGVSEPSVQVSSPDGWQDWTRVEHFAASGPDDRHYLLDAYAGELVFGPMVRLADGGVRQYGAVPAAGESIRIRDYAIGGGPTGNVAARTIDSLRSSIPFVTSVENRYAATGGTPGESLAEAMDRGPLTLRSRDRAVTVEDYEVLARQAAPEIARVRCVPSDGDRVPAGTVKVLVVPAAPDRAGQVELANLIPSEETMARIAARLDEARVAGVQILIEPPRYRAVTVVARLIARPRVRAEEVTRAALEALYRFVSPLPGGGPDGSGWPFGRPVQYGELFSVLRDVRGVEMVEDLRLFSADPVSGKRGGEVQRINLDKHSLAFSFEHQVRVEEH